MQTYCLKFLSRAILVPHSFIALHDFSRIMPLKGLTEWERNSRVGGLNISTFLSFFHAGIFHPSLSLSPFLPTPDLRAARVRTSRAVIRAKKKKGIRSRGRRVAPWFTMAAKKWIIPHLSSALHLFPPPVQLFLSLFLRLFPCPRSSSVKPFAKCNSRIPIGPLDYIAAEFHSARSLSGL